MNFDNIYKSANYLKENLNKEIDVAIVLGSGLGGVVDSLNNKIVIPYTDIPFFPTSNVKGHEGNLVIGDVNGLNVAILQGRVHYYEGKGLEPVVYPLYVMKLLGVKRFITTNACGGINENFIPGDLMIMTDFINLIGVNPLIGDNNEDFGPRFPDMSEPFKLDLIKQAKDIANKLDIKPKEGIFSYFNGPCYETAAEIRALKIMGADSVGMSTVPEVIVANYLGIEVLGISCITNMATGIQKIKHSHENVLKVANESSEKLTIWLKEILNVWSQEKSICFIKNKS